MQGFKELGLDFNWLEFIPKDIISQECAALGSYPSCCHTAGETEARGAWRTAYFGMRVRGAGSRIRMQGPSLGEGVWHRVWGLAGSFSCRPCPGEVSEGQAGAGALG